MKLHAAVAVGDLATGGRGDAVGAVEPAHGRAPRARFGIAGLAVVDHGDRSQGRRGVVAEDEGGQVQAALGGEAVIQSDSTAGSAPSSSGTTSATWYDPPPTPVNE